MRVKGRLNPLTVNPVPVGLTWVTVTVDPPEFVRVSESAWLLPTSTLPKFRVVGVAARTPAVCPSPARGMFTVGIAPVFATAKFPLTAPADCGVNVTLNDCPSPAGRVRGKLSPFTAKPVPEAVTCVTVRLEPPVLVSVSVSVCRLPTRIFPKLRLAELGVTVPAVCEPPERATLTVGVEPVFAIARLPVTGPADAGVKTTVKPWL